MLILLEGADAGKSEVAPVAIFEPGEGGNIHKLIIGGKRIYF